MQGVQTRRRLGDLLVDAGLLTPAQLSDVLHSRITVDGRPERLGEAAVRLGYTTADRIGTMLAQQLGLEYVGDQSLQVDFDLGRRIPSALIQRHNVVPLGREDDTVVVACTDPTNIIGLDDVRVAVGARHLRVVVAPEESVRTAIADSYGTEFSGESLAEAFEDDTEELPDDALDVSDGPIIRLADEIVATAVRSRASDIHIEPKQDRCVVRHRIDGVLHEVMSLPRTVSAPLVSRIKLQAGLDIAEKRKPQDGRSHFRGIPGRGGIDAVDLRLSTLPSMTGESIVIRLLRRDEGRHDLSQIGLDAAQEAQLLSVVERPQGLVLVTGPTGSGKTSTLYALLAHLATSDRKLITVEDPVEYELDGIVQTQVNERAGYTLTSALRAMLRQDPDIVMVGEIRDPETAELALQASLTGHLVLSTLHTNDAPSAVVRLAELGMPGYLVASALSMVVAQRLARRTCPECAVHVHPTERQQQRLLLKPDQVFVEGRGCPTCHHTGYMGRTGTFEMLTVDGAVRELIATGAPTSAIAQAARQNGLRSLREDGLRKAAGGETTLEEVLRVTPTTEHAADTCPICAQQVDPDFATCPWCASDLRPLHCTHCERAMDPAWIACPACSTPAQRVADGGAAEGLPTVLVVDDDDHVRAAVRAMLAGDYEVVEAATGGQALAALHAVPVSAVLLDKGLPDMDGYDVCREIRVRPAVRDVPVLVITGHVDAQVESDGLRAGADDWLAKPLDPEVLSARVGRLVSRAVRV